MDIIELKATDLAAMLCSRVCHDLINPIGAIGNGLEVLSDPNQGEMAEGARDLIASAAKQSRAKLEFARLAYGASSTAVPISIRANVSALRAFCSKSKRPILNGLCR